MTEGKPLLKIEDLHLSRDGKEILRGVDLTIDRHSVHAILGLNGSGKSTLAYTLIGSSGYAPSKGRIVFDGEDITAMPISERGRRGLTLAWQEPARIEGLTVSRYLSLGMREPNAKRTELALESVALTPDYMDRMVDDSLSGGERKRIELAAVYAMRPKLAILDEPDSGIDELSLNDIATLMRQMVSEGSTVLIISHRNQMVNVADVASLICEGSVRQTGDPQTVCDRYSLCCRPCDRHEAVESETAYERL